MALRLAEEGADVVLTYENSAERATQVVEQIKAGGRRALAIQADSAIPEALTAAVDEAAAMFGRLDILVNNAGVFLVGPLEDLGSAEIDRTLAVNVRAPFAASRAAVRHMGTGGRIISIGSNVAERAVFPGLALYSMSKAALVGMTKGLARELGPRGVTANLVIPGPTDTDTNPADGRTRGDRRLHGCGPLRASGRDRGHRRPPGKCGRSYITGASIHVDGGFTA